MAKFNAEQFAALLTAHSQTEQACILCSRPTRQRGVYVPNEPGTLGAAKGKQRHVIYPICERHPPSKKMFDLCEKKIMEAAKSGELELAIHKPPEELEGN